MKPLLFLLMILMAGCSDPSSPCDKLRPDKNGIIHHPRYGDYPQKITYEEMQEQGAWHPCQEMTVVFDVPKDIQKILRGEK